MFFIYFMMIHAMILARKVFFEGFVLGRQVFDIGFDLYRD